MDLVPPDSRSVQVVPSLFYLVLPAVTEPPPRRVLRSVPPSSCWSHWGPFQIDFLLTRVRPLVSVLGPVLGAAVAVSSSQFSPEDVLAFFFVRRIVHPHRWIALFRGSQYGGPPGDTTPLPSRLLGTAVFRGTCAVSSFPLYVRTPRVGVALSVTASFLRDVSSSFPLRPFGGWARAPLRSSTVSLHPPPDFLSRRPLPHSSPSLPLPFPVSGLLDRLPVFFFFVPVISFFLCRDRFSARVPGALLPGCALGGLGFRPRVPTFHWASSCQWNKTRASGQRPPWVPPSILASGLQKLMEVGPPTSFPGLTELF